MRHDLIGKEFAQECIEYFNTLLQKEHTQRFMEICLFIRDNGMADVRFILSLNGDEEESKDLRETMSSRWAAKKVLEWSNNLGIETEVAIFDRDDNLLYIIQNPERIW